MKEKGGIKLKEFRVFDVVEIPVKGNRVAPTNEFLKFTKEEIQQSIVHRFESRVKMYPHKAAIRVDDGLLTYDALNRCSNRVAQQVLEKYDGTCRLSKQEKTGKKDRPIEIRIAPPVDSETRQPMEEVVLKAESLPTAALLFGHNLEMIIGILGVLKAGKAYVPLDATYPRERLELMLEDSNCRVIVTDANNLDLAVKLRNNVNKQIPIINVNDTAGDRNISQENLLLAIGPQNLAYILYTSGSTGTPKGVMQNHRNVLHFARIYTNALHIHSEDRLTLFSSYSFDAAKMDIYAALLNGATLYPYDIKRAGSLDRLPRWLRNEKLTIFHSIPTLYRYFMDILPASKEDALPGIRLLVMGGEAVYQRDVDRYKQYFSAGCLFINGLGPTESTVTLQYFIDKHTEVSRGSVPVGFPAAETEVYIITEYGREARIFEIGEIVFKSDYLALGYLNHPGKTRQVFTKDPLNGSGRVYLTGDLGRRLPDGTIEFVGRKDFQVKIRGYRVELGEIEARLAQVDSIKKSAVVCQQRRNGENYLVAFYKTGQEQTVDEPGLVRIMKESLPDYMVPNAFYRIDDFPLTSTGKIDRKALAQLDLSRTGVLSKTVEYEAPQNPTQEKLVQIWSRVLRTEENPGIHDNFFTLGGNSLTVILLVSELHKAFNVKVPLARVFESPTIKGLSQYITQTKTSIYDTIAPTETREYYPQTSAQKRLFFLDHFEDIGTSHNIPNVFEVRGNLDKKRLASTLKSLIKRHESLRTSFHSLGNQPIQRVHGCHELEFEIRFNDLTAGERKQAAGDRPQATAENRQPAEGKPGTHLSSFIRRLSSEFIRPFDLSMAPLLRFSLMQISEAQYLVLFDMHHIISDGTSRGMLTDEFVRLYEGEELPALRIQYKDFARWQNHLFKIGKIKEQENYWLNIYSSKEEIPVLHMPADFSRPEVFQFQGDWYGFSLPGTEAKLFQRIGINPGATLYMNILAVLNVLLHKYTAQEDIIVGTGIMGRPHADLQNLIGMFVNTLAMRNYPERHKTYESFLGEVIGNSVKAFENQDVQFEELVDRLAPERDPSRNPLFDISMVVQNFRRVRGRRSSREELNGKTENPGQIEILPVADNDGSTITYKNTTTKFDMTFFVHEVEDDVYIGIEYYTGIFKKETIQRLACHFKQVVKAVIHNPGILLKDIQIMPEEEKEEVLHAFNDTAREYPHDKTIPHLFAEQVERTPDCIALVYEDEELTYRELDARANQIAAYLYYEKEVSPGSEKSVGVLMSPALHCPISLLGIIKAGGVYIPLDPELPQERIKFMINDAGIGTVISGKKHINLLNRLQWECQPFHSYLCMDSHEIHSEEEEEKSQLMDEELWHHVGESAVDDITGGGWVSSYTGKPFSRIEMDEYGDNILKKLEPLLFKEMKVLEIGCASGISMYRIAPKVGLYYGTDLSAVIVEKNKQKVQELGIQNIKLAHLAAHEIHQLQKEERNFDLIIMNSVIQCFHGHHYLRKVLRQCIDLLGDKGYLFFGDIMDLEKRKELVQELTAFKYDPGNRHKGYTTKTDFSSELFLSRYFWKDMKEETGEIQEIKFSDKHFTIENELTKFRYDVLISINKQASFIKKGQKKKYQEDISHISKYDPGKVLFLTKLYPDNLAYIIYTSGTTGQPKGVLVGHRGIANLNIVYTDEFKINNKDKIIQFANISFDASIWEIFMALLNGAALHLLPAEIINDYELFHDYLNRHLITITTLPPIYANHLQIEELCHLRLLLTAGSSPNLNFVQKCMDKGNFEYINAYGPTEDTICSSYWKFRKNEDLQVATIGGPLVNKQFYIVDENTFPQPIGVAGELCVSGPGLARGYLNRPELTADKFCLRRPGDSFYKYRPLDPCKNFLLYRTGDRARWLANGTVEFLGRVDQQVKLRGFRIEVEEIQNQLLKHQNIKDAAVIDRTGNNNDKYLCAYVTGTINEKESWSEDLREFLALTLPDYMIPSLFVQMDKLPLTTSGKLDSKALPEPQLLNDRENKYFAPRNPTEGKLAQIWAEVLHIERNKIGIDENFFQLGGHSLKVTILVSKIHKELNIKVPLSEVFNRQTIRGLSGYIRQAKKSKHKEIVAIEKKEYYELSSAQKRLYFLQQFDLKSTGYNMPLVLPLADDIRKNKLELTMKKLITRHESLRTSFLFVESEPVQRIRDQINESFAIEYYNLAQDNTEIENYKIQNTNYKQITNDNSQNIDRIINSFIRPFDLSRAPLVRSGLIEHPGGNYTWLVDIHHIISDGTSQMVLTEDFMALYDGEKLTRLKLHYKDFSLWQNRLFSRGEIKPQEEYWLKLFSGELPHLDLPVDNERPEVFTFSGARFSFVLEKEDTLAFKSSGNKNSATLYMNVLAALNVLFYKYTGQTDIVIGGVIAGRPHADLQQIIGMFVNTLPMRNTPIGEKTYEFFLQEVVTNSVEAFENQDVQFEQLVDKLNLERDTSRNPLFDITMVVQNFRDPGGMQPGNKNTENLPEEDIKTSAKFDMTFMVHELGDVIFVSIDYYTAVFTAGTLRRLEKHFKNVIKAVTANPLVKLRDIEIITREEKEEILHTFNKTTRDYPREKSIYGLFAEQVEKTPDHAALIGKKLQVANNKMLETAAVIYLTYKELDRRIAGLAHLLQERGAGPETIVILMMERCIEMVIGLLGILKAGGAYLPVDPNYPEKQKQYMTTESGSTIVLTGPELEKISSATTAGSTPPLTPVSNPGRFVSADSLAYVLYTSGTTGQPKGVMVEHRSVIRLVKNTNYVEFYPGDRILQTGALDFDASTFEIWGALLNGITLCLVPKEEIISARHLKENLRKYHITILWLTAPLFNQMVEADEEIFSSLRHFLVGGDVLSPDHINRLKRRYPDLKVTNGYGPTENTTFSTTLLIEKQYTKSIPIGKPIANSTVYIVDSGCHILPGGLAGEIIVGGDGVSRGYMNNPELTSEKFIFARKTQRHKRIYFSWCPGALAAKLYRTGDQGRWLHDGTIEFLGRIDTQVKIRGFRIELEEIQHHICAHEQVKEAVVLAKKDNNGAKYLCAYVVPGKTGTIEFEVLKEYLSRQLPAYMVPALFVKLEKLPLMSNGKVDRQVLLKSGAFRPPDDSTFLAPGTHLEKIIARAWQEVLNLEKVGLSENFFEIGGNSINLLNVHRKLEKDFEIEIPIVKLFEYTTIRSIAVFLGQVNEDEEKEERFNPTDHMQPGIPIHSEKTGEKAGIAIIGMAGIFPGANNIQEFWENIKNGVESIAFFSQEELERVGIPAEHSNDPDYVKAKGVIEKPEYFDASFFDYTPREALIMDPQMRVFHQCVWHALEDGGYNSFSYPGRIGLYAGSSSNFHWEALTMFSSMNRFASGVQGGLLRNRDFMCSRISYKLNLKGPSFSVQTACSTSLVAIHLACQGLLNRECELGLAGGVTISTIQTMGYYYQEGMIESPDGHCRAFDSKAMGLVGGSGAGVVLLKPLEKSIADGDHIYAVIKGTAMNNDGLRKIGYTAPSVEGQVEVLRSAQLMAGIEPETITYIETHGTATPLGDPVEIEALKKAFNANLKNTDRQRFCGIGSVKTNVGHLDTASGVTGFIKTVLALQHRLIPPNLHFNTPNPKLGIEDSPFYVVSQLTEWQTARQPRRAGVSSLGIGGTNAHAILEEWCEDSKNRRQTTDNREQGLNEREYQLILLSARTKTALEKITQNLATHFAENPSIKLPDVAYTLQVGRRSCQYRKILVCTTLEEAAAALSKKSKDKQKRTQTFFCQADPPPVVFIFPGQGSHYVGMGWRLYQTEPVFRAEMDRCFEIAASQGYDLKDILYPNDSVSKMKGTDKMEKGEGESRVNQTVIIQLLIFIFEYSLAALLQKWGIHPTAMIGYSLGEYTAACLSRIFSLKDAIKLVAFRGELIQTTPQGAMLSVPLPEKELKPMLNDEISLAILNGPSCVAAGSTGAVEAFEEKMKQKRLLCTRVNISHAVHSRLMEPIREAFVQEVSKIRLNKPRVPLISNVSGHWLTAGEAANPHYWAEQMCAPVRFSKGIDELIKEEHAVFIEVGPGRVLGNIVRQHPDKKTGQKVVSLIRHQQENSADDFILHRALGQLWLYGLDIDWSGYYTGRDRSRLALPTYPFEGKRYWIDEDIFKRIAGVRLYEKNREEPDEETGELLQEPGLPGPSEPEIYPDEREEEFVAPRDQLEQNIARVWEEFLGFEKIGIYDNFFQLNGDSLTATRLVGRIKEIYPVEVTLQDFFEEPTIAHLGMVIKKLLIQKLKNLSPEERKQMIGN